MKSAIIIKFLPILSILFVVGCVEKNPYLEVEVPHPPRAENLHTKYSDFPFGKAISYKVKVDFPAKDIIDFYNKSFSVLGYEITEYNPKSDSKWTLFSQKTLEFQEVTGKPATWSRVGATNIKKINSC